MSSGGGSIQILYISRRTKATHNTLLQVKGLYLKTSLK